MNIDLLKAANHWRDDTMTTKNYTYTPGPWVREKQPTGDWHISKQDAITAHCIIPCWGEQEDAHNARLIAAAPALLAALKLCLSLQHQCWHGVIHCGDCGYCLGMNAIAQAEGGTQP